jgi:hypothetical protein
VAFAGRLSKRSRSISARADDVRQSRSGGGEIDFQNRDHFGDAYPLLSEQVELIQAMKISRETIGKISGVSAEIIDDVFSGEPVQLSRFGEGQAIKLGELLTAFTTSMLGSNLDFQLRLMIYNHALSVETLALVCGVDKSALAMFLAKRLGPDDSLSDAEKYRVAMWVQELSVFFRYGVDSGGAFGIVSGRDFR